MFDNPELYLYGVGATVLIGLVTALLLPRLSSKLRIVALEFVIGVLFIMGVQVPTINAVGADMARSNTVGGYEEFWGGSIVAKSETTECHYDGWECANTHDCDPYLDTETYYDTEYYTDANGKLQSRQVLKTRIVTKHHTCPWATRETDYWLEDSFGQRFDLGSHWLDANPKPFRASFGVPGGLERGAPARWTEADEAFKAGNPLPAHKVNKYPNPLLANQKTVLKNNSGSIDKYLKAGLLPDHTHNINKDPIYDGFMADEMAFIGDFPDQGMWQLALGRLNAEVGAVKQGDVHMVALRASRLDESDAQEYINALVAYSQSPKVYGKRSLAKNTIMVVVAVDDSLSTVVWSRAKTGPPIGNGGMIDSLGHLGGTRFTPEALLGQPHVVMQGHKFKYEPGSGATEKIVLSEFHRICMLTCEPGQDGGFGYLTAEIALTPGQKWGIFGMNLLIAAIIWAFFAWLPWSGRIDGLARWARDLSGRASRRLLRRRMKYAHYNLDTKGWR
jgi:hypothetical protein